MGEPLVSVLLPTYNRAQWIASAIASVQEQTWAAWELLIIDDGSTDDTRLRLPADPRIRYLYRPHTGNLAAVRNAGLTEARGVYVAFQDSDDRWRRDRLRLQVEQLERRPEAGWCHGDFRMIDEHDAIIARRSGAPWRPREGRLLREILAAEASIALQSVLVRQEWARALEGFDETMPFGDDYDFIIRLAGAAPACAVDDIVAEIREHPARATKRRYDHALYIAMALGRCGRRLTDRPLRRICRQRATSLLRHYLATARARGELTGALWRATKAIVAAARSGRPTVEVKL